MITVKQVFETAYGQIPDGATCHIGHWGGPFLESHKMEPTYKPEGISWPCSLTKRDGWANHATHEFVMGPDISDRPAESFRGFFGKEYDDVLDALIAESEHPLNDLKFSDATPEQFKEFWSAKGLTCWDGNVIGQLEFARCQIEVTSNDGCIYIQDERNYVLVGEATTFGEAAEAIAALENALGMFGE